MRFLVLVILLMGCNPVKTVLKSEDKTRQVFEAGVRNGWCVNDTIVLVDTKDSVVYKDSIIERIEKVPCADFDTTIGRARIRVSSGVLTYSAKDSLVYRVKTVKETVKDRALENILKRDILDRDSAISGLKSDVVDLKGRVADIRAIANKWKTRFWLLIALIGLGVAAGVYLKRR